MPWLQRLDQLSLARKAVRGFGCERDARKSERQTCELSVLSTDCGMNCHKQCKDLVVFECKKRIKSPAVSTENISSVVPTSSLCPLGTKDLLHGK